MKYWCYFGHNVQPQYTFCTGIMRTKSETRVFMFYSVLFSCIQSAMKNMRCPILKQSVRRNNTKSFFLSCKSTSLVCKTQQKHKYLTTRLVLCESLAHKFRLGVEMPLIFKLNSCITWWNHQLTVEYICAKNIFKLVYYNAKTSKVD